MTRYKKYLQSIGYKLDCDYPCIPFSLDKYNRNFVEGIYTRIVPEGIEITTCYNSIVISDTIGKNGKIIAQAAE